MEPKTYSQAMSYRISVSYGRRNFTCKSAYMHRSHVSTRSSASRNKRVCGRPGGTGCECPGRRPPSVGRADMDCRTSRPPPERGRCGRGSGSKGVPGIRAAHLDAAPAAASTGIQQSGPGNGLGQGGQIAQHDLDKMPNRVGRILGPAATTDPPIDKKLKQIEGERPDKQDRHQSISGMPEDVP